MSQMSLFRHKQQKQRVIHVIGLLMTMLISGEITRNEDDQCTYIYFFHLNLLMNNVGKNLPVFAHSDIPI